MSAGSVKMNWGEALQAMEKGFLVRNNNFTSEEFFEMQNGRIFAEDGCPMDGWYQGEGWQNEGWSVIDDPRRID